jgi:hypothetical protein
MLPPIIRANSEDQREASQAQYFKSDLHIWIKLMAQGKTLARTV